MMSLEDYIQENCFIKYLYEHIAIEFAHEYYAMLDNKFKIFERLGKFNNSSKIVTYIFEKLIFDNDGKEGEFDINCTILKTFFDKLTIKVEYANENNGEYVKHEDKHIFMNLNINKDLDPTKDYGEIFKLVLHELLHAYEDINRKDSIFAHFDKGYQKSYKFMQTSFIKTHKQLFEFGYFFNDQERNAYFSSIYDDIKKVLQELNMTNIEDFEYDKFLVRLKETDIWKTYFDIGELIMSIDNISDKEKKNVQDIFKIIKNKNMTFNQCKKELMNKWNKFQAKFNQLVPKCICDILVVRNWKVPNNGK